MVFFIEWFFYGLIKGWIFKFVIVEEFFVYV